MSTARPAAARPRPAGTRPLLPARAAGLPGGGPQPGHQRGPVHGAACGVLGQPGLDQRPQRSGDRLERHRLELMLADQHLLGAAGERRAAGQALIKGGRAAYTSAAGLAAWPANCSGGAYASVPAATA